MDPLPTPYEKALALQDFFRDPDNFTYDTNVKPGHSDSAIEDFLFRTRRGYWRSPETSPRTAVNSRWVASTSTPHSRCWGPSRTSAAAITTSENDPGCVKTLLI